MVALNRSCPEPDDFAGGASAGTTLPFLPTMLVAACIALGAVCWESAKPQPAPSGAPATVAVEAPSLPRMAGIGPGLPAVDPARSDGTGRPPAVVAFADQFPVTLPSTPEDRAGAGARIEARPPVRAVRAAPMPSGCPGHRCRDGAAQAAASPLRRPPAGSRPVPDTAQPFAAAVTDTETVETRQLDRALPFAPTLAPTVKAFQHVVGFVGTQAASLGGEAAALGGAVTDLVGLR